MDDLNYLSRLKVGQEQFLEENTKKQESRKKLLDDYKKLIERLKTLPDTVSQPTMIPVGNIAFLPGKLIHTNEIMVLLGDNWFAERSTKQSIEIAQRRVKLVEKHLDDLKTEYNHIKGNLNYTEQFEQLKTDPQSQEIKEDVPTTYKSNKGKRRIAHKANHDITPRGVTFKPTEVSVESRLPHAHLNNGFGESTINHDELMSRLNQLEREEHVAEEEEHERVMASIMEGTYAQPSSTDHEANARDRHVKFRNVESCSNDDEGRGENMIQFQHTGVRNRSSSEPDIRMKTESEANGTILSPADIYEQFSNQSSSHLSDSEDSKPLKSILKKDSRSGSTENLRLKPILKSSPEHRPGTPEALLDEPHSILKTPPDTQASDRRPGTPEHVLDRPAPHSILKTDDVYYVSDEDDPEIRPILKSHELVAPPLVGEHHHQGSDEMRSILKHSSLESPTKRPFSPESASSTADYNNPGSSILKGDSSSRNRNVTISPDPPGVSWGHDATAGAAENYTSLYDPKPILKHQSSEVITNRTAEKQAFSGRVVEKENSDKSNSNKTTKKKPMSMFKASRMKK